MMARHDDTRRSTPSGRMPYPGQIIVVGDACVYHRQLQVKFISSVHCESGNGVVVRILT
jgi:hypothetical protein